MYKYFPCEDETENTFAKTIEAIYLQMCDEMSRQIFADRMLYSMTRDYQYLRKIVFDSKIGKCILDLLAEKDVYIYGAGTRGERLMALLPDINWKGYIDKKKTGLLNGLQILNLEEGKKLDDCYIIISNSNRPQDIKDELILSGYLEEKIIVLGEYDNELQKNIYFDKTVLSKVSLKPGFFLDAGCYDGTDTIRYLEMNGDSSASVIAVEADETNFQFCKKKLGRYENVHLIHAGLSNSKEIKRFSSGGVYRKENSRFSEEGDTEVSTVCIDDIVQDKIVSFIKMDIEGYEEKALNGGAAIISRDKPFLAISVYHKRADIWRLPKLILELNPNYKFFLRHYSIGITATVLYAVDNDSLYSDFKKII